MPKRIKIGDVIEIPVKSGFAYAQYVHKHAKYGSLLLVFSTIHNKSITDFSFLKDGLHYFAFFPLGPSVNQKIFNIVSNQSLPDYAINFPLFKTGVENSIGKVENWWLWDGDKEWKVDELNEEQKKLSYRGIWNDTLLIERIEQGWSPEIVN